MTNTIARYGTKACRTCGATFAKSRADGTVNCPTCRGAAPAPKAKADPYAPAPDGTVCTIGGGSFGRCGAPAVRVLVGTPYAECAGHAR